MILLFPAVFPTSQFCLILLWKKAWREAENARKLSLRTTELSLRKSIFMKRSERDSSKLRTKIPHALKLFRLKEQLTKFIPPLLIYFSNFYEFLNFPGRKTR